MASFSVWLGIFFVGGLLALGLTQTVIDFQNSPTGAVLAEAKPSEIPQVDQQKLNLCQNSCMNQCVSQPGDEPKCRAICDEECGVWHAG